MTAVDSPDDLYERAVVLYADFVRVHDELIRKCGSRSYNGYLSSNSDAAADVLRIAEFLARAECDPGIKGGAQ